MIKEYEKKTKGELIKDLKWISRKLRQLANGEADDYEYENYGSYMWYRDEGFKLLRIIESRGKVKSDWTHQVPFFKALNKAEKELQNRLGY